eukprot:CRZ04502.1 hypothetical protein [Spongospora subterranea]
MPKALLILSGRMVSPAYQQAKAVAKQIAAVAYDILSAEIIDILDLDWEIRVQQIQLKFGIHIVGSCSDLFAYHSKLGWIGSTVADLQEWGSSRFQIGPIEGDVDFEESARNSVQEYCREHAKESRFVSMTFASGNLGPIGSVVFELFYSIMPKTCDNFLKLCTGQCGDSENGITLRYLNTPIHRVVKGAWIQGGDIVTGNGDKGESVYGGTFEDECFAIKHDRAGIL